MGYLKPDAEIRLKARIRRRKCVIVPFPSGFELHLKNLKSIYRYYRQGLFKIWQAKPYLKFETLNLCWLKGLSALAEPWNYGLTKLPIFTIVLA